MPAAAVCMYALICVIQLSARASGIVELAAYTQAMSLSLNIFGQNSRFFIPSYSSWLAGLVGSCRGSGICIVFTVAPLAVLCSTVAY